jgi:hypothetical protein
MLSSQEDVSSAFLAVCIRCGRQDSVVARCAECGGAVILTRESQAVRESSPDLDRALHLPGLDEPPRRIARGTLPPIATTTARAPAAGSPRLVDLPVPDLRPSARLGLTVTVTLLSAGIVGLAAALLGGGL